MLKASPHHLTASSVLRPVLAGALTVEEDMDEEGCTGKEVDEVDL